ncbi:hypothetical protein BHV42_07855 [Candidatus Melainabacteria bacterium MEL.A1]|nr:hypothetical protein BHV42_07855 [Candidatus Melainabacteria bacterium MEL.A1]
MFPPCEGGVRWVLILITKFPLRDITHPLPFPQKGRSYFPSLAIKDKRWVLILIIMFPYGLAPIPLPLTKRDI